MGIGSQLLIIENANVTGALLATGMLSRATLSRLQRGNDSLGFEMDVESRVAVFHSPKVLGRGLVMEVSASL